METLFAILIGFLFAAGVYGLLRRSLVRMIVGIVLLSQSINLLVFFSGGLTRGKPAFTTSDAEALQVADPLPQALVLTAVVIGFGLIAFTIVLFQKVNQSVGHDDSRKILQTDT
jgi:multicomponent Na+:H+ antiporter subunit C